MTTVPFLGAEFRVNDRIGSMPMMRYARVVKREQEREKSGGEPSGDAYVEMFDATLSLLEQCVHPDDWPRFERHTSEQGADQEQYMEFAGLAMAAIAGRPTERPSDSSDGPQTISPRSTADSSSPGTLPREAQQVVDRLNQEGRPSLALMVREKAESESLSA